MKKIFYKSIFVTLLLGFGLYFYSSLPDVSLLKKQNPKTTSFMELRDQEYRHKGQLTARRQTWRSYEMISNHLKKAILISEDSAFYSHTGVDFVELKESILKDWETKSFKRGGSTITMQLAKNLYLNPSKNPLRKLKEIAIAWQIENKLTKKRIFEIYLNIVEWGPNLYGAEAAANHYFGKSATDLDAIEAATLAALLPNPRNPGEKSLRRRRNLILERMAKIGHIDESDHNRAKETPLFRKAGDFTSFSD